MAKPAWNIEKIMNSMRFFPFTVLLPAGLLLPLSFFLLVSCEAAPKREVLEIKPHPIVSDERLELTRIYNKIHYGLDSYQLKSPAIVVIHHTAIGSLKGSFRAFDKARIPGHRGYIKKFGAVNVGVHFLVDKNGDIYSLLPTGITGRHAIGLNHVSIGIENVAAKASRLTEAQLQANAALVNHLKYEYASIKYVIGHQEYTKRDLPHYKLYKELDPKYRPTVKSDPGPRFMKKLRARLKEKYKLQFEK
ncbi:MAG: N-acetylmuramoyl-L-alanine amidase [SAR324 cluster bacterium]|nr:N-acetylmuramoyl-L-alanine amidase [SAR324 cluster bacterium]